MITIPPETCLTRTVDPAICPVAVGQFVDMLGLGSDVDQIPLYELNLRSAVDWVEQFLRRQLISATYTLTLPSFGYSQLLLPRPPVQSITSITYSDVDNNPQTLSTSVYELTTGVVSLKHLQSWPTTYSKNDAVAITYVAGYGDKATDVPDAIRMAILRLACEQWRGAQMGCSSAVSDAVKSILGPYRLIAL